MRYPARVLHVRGSLIMNKNLKNLFLIMALLPLSAFAQNITVHILEFDPPAGTTLAPSEPLYVRVSYESDAPMRLRVIGYLEGKRIEAHYFTVSPTDALYPAGSGEIATYVAYVGKTHVDEVRIEVLNEHSDLIYSVPMPVEMRWSGRTTQRWREPAEWVRTLLYPGFGPSEQSQPPEPFSYFKRYWIFQVSVVLLGVLLAWWIEKSPKEIHFRWSDKKAFDPSEKTAAAVYRGRTKRGGVLGRAKRGRPNWYALS